MKPEALAQTERFRALLPDYEWPNFCLATLLAENGRQEEARELLENTLEIRGDFTQAQDLLERINAE